MFVKSSFWMVSESVVVTLAARAPNILRIFVIFRVIAFMGACYKGTVKVS